MYGVSPYGTAPYGSLATQEFLDIDFAIFINGVDVTLKCSPNSFKFRKTLNRRATASFMLELLASEARPGVGEEVLVFDQGVRIFGGSVEKPGEAIPLGTQRVKMKIGCSDFNQLIDKRIIIQNYEVPGQTAGDIVRSLITDFFSQEGITPGIIQDGPAVSKAIFNYQRGALAMDELNKLSALSWRVNDFKELEFRERSSDLAPFNITDGNQPFRKMKVSENRKQYRNRQYLRAGTALTDTQIETQSGDGSKQTFSFEYPMGQTPIVEVDRGAGFIQEIVGIRNKDLGIQWSYQIASTQIAQEDGQPVLGVGDLVRVTYRGQFPLNIVSELPLQVTERQGIEQSSGLYENVFTQKNIDDFTLATDTANGLLRQFGEIPEIVTYETDTPGLRPGMLQTITLTDEDLADDFLITQVTFQRLSSTSPITRRYGVSLISTEYQGGWVEFWRQIERQGKDFAIRENEVVEDVTNAIDTIQFDDELDFLTPITDGSDDPYTGLITGSASDFPEFTKTIGRVVVGKLRP